MPNGLDQSHIENVASSVMAALANHRQIPVFSGTGSGFDLSDAYRVTSLLRIGFESRGEKIIGRKIGFTNREMWAAHGVNAPIWGYCTDRSTRDLDAAPVLRTSGFTEPRIEPEIIFGLGAKPRPSMDDAELLDCIEWISLGYEVVQSIYPGWKFTAADTIAANALHGSLLIGKRHLVAPRRSAWIDELANFKVELYCNGELSQTGGGSLVLHSPLLALQHLVRLLAEDQINPPLGAGEIISTGTLTLAMPVSAGETWTTRVRGIPLEPIELRFER